MSNILRHDLVGAAAKVDLGCCESAPGWVSVDGRPGGDFVMDFERDRLPFADRSVTAFNCSHLFEHLSGVGQANLLAEVYRCLSPSGYAVFSFPNTATSPHLAGYADHRDRSLTAERFLGFQNQARPLRIDRSILQGHGLEKYDTGTLQCFKSVGFDFDVMHVETDLYFPYVVYPEEQRRSAYLSNLNVVENFRIVLTLPGSNVDLDGMLIDLPAYEFMRETEAVCQAFRHILDCLAHFMDHFADLSVGVARGEHSAAAMVLMTDSDAVMGKHSERAERLLSALTRREDRATFESKTAYIADAKRKIDEMGICCRHLLDGRVVRAALPAQIVDLRLAERVERLEALVSQLSNQ